MSFFLFKKEVESGFRPSHRSRSQGNATEKLGEVFGMKYIIMCGGHYRKWYTPRQLTQVNGESIVERTIRLLRENGVEDISISSNNPVFKQFGLPVLVHENSYNSVAYNNSVGHWCDAFYPTNEPTCYVFGDVIFSPAAIKTIVETPTDDIMLFGSKPPFSDQYPKPWIEPFAFKVQDTDHLKRAVKETKKLDRMRKFKRKPIAWEVWSVIRGTDINAIDYSYTAINDYTCDIDYPYEVENVLKYIKE